LQNLLLEKPTVQILDNDQAGQKRVQSADRLLEHATFTLTELQELGTIRVIDTDHNCASEMVDQVENMIKTMFLKDGILSPPTELRRRIENAGWTFQQICAASGMNFCKVLTQNLSALCATDEQASSLSLAYRDYYVQMAKEILPNAFFSNTQEMFITVSSKASGGAAPYLSLGALRALRDVIGKAGCLFIYRALADLSGELGRELCAALGRILTGPSPFFDTGILQIPDPAGLVTKLGHLCAVLRLREMFRPFAGEPKVDPNADVDLVSKFEEPMQELIANPATVVLFAGLFANSYWEVFNYDIAHDAVKDNSHLWARFFDLFAVCATRTLTDLTPDLFYRELFLQSLSSIHKARAHFGKKRGQYQGLELLILLDHVVTESAYANYSQLEQYVAYQFIRSLYTARLSRIGR
jgi:hypothetical protein